MSQAPRTKALGGVPAGDRIDRRRQLLAALVVVAVALLWVLDRSSVDWTWIGATAAVVIVAVAGRGAATPALGWGALVIAPLVAGGQVRSALLLAVAAGVGGGVLAWWGDGVDRRRERIRGVVVALAVVVAAVAAASMAARVSVWAGAPGRVQALLVAVAAGLAGTAGLLVLDRVDSGPRTWGRMVADVVIWAAAASLPLGTIAVVALAAVAALELLDARRRATRERHRGRDLERLSRAGERLSRGASDLEEAVSSIWRELRHAVPIEWFHLEVVAHGREGQEWAGDPDGNLVTGRPQPPAAPPMLPGIHRRSGWRQLEHELEAEGRPLAVVRLWCDPRRLGRQSPELIERLLPQLGARLHRGVLGREAREDPLTGAALRRVFERRLLESFERAAERGESVSVALVDLDFFKRINDVYGHAAGDQALIHAAAVLRSRLRDDDLCARWGGEEFALLLEGLGAAEAMAVVERLRAEVEALPIWFEGERLPVTMSGGVATFPGLFVESGKELLELADQALYAAKGNGRNRILAFLAPGRFGTPDGEELRDGDYQAKAPPRLFV
jgi:diguanylate cyclase (GGDEF)-like protein